jgi:hypothetical protein
MTLSKERNREIADFLIATSKVQAIIVHPGDVFMAFDRASVRMKFFDWLRAKNRKLEWWTGMPYDQIEDFNKNAPEEIRKEVDEAMEENKERR